MTDERNLGSAAFLAPWTELGTADGVRRFRPRGAGRFFEAAFLLVWLCAWAVGEAFALILIGNGIYALMTGGPAWGSSEPLRLGPALVTGAFLLVWLTIWTIGGVMAARELLRALWAEDRLWLDRDRLRRIHRLGPMVSTQHWPRAEIRRVFVQSTSAGLGALMAQVGSGVIELTNLGTVTERSQAAGDLRAALGLPEHDSPTDLAALPEGWQEIIDPRGQRLLVPNLRTRRTQAHIVSLITGIVWTGVVLLAWESRRDPNLWVVTVMAGVPAAWLARQAIWLHRGRKEWRIEHAKLVHQRRFGVSVTELVEARALELIESTDSDGDRWYELRAINLSAPVHAPPVGSAKVRPQQRIHHTLHDPTEPRCLGLWLAQRARIPLCDRVPGDAARQAEFARVQEELSRSGRLGLVAVRVLERIQPAGANANLVTLHGARGRSDTLESSADLTTWTNLFDLPGTNGLWRIPLADANAPRQFLRARVLPQVLHLAVADSIISRVKGSPMSAGGQQMKGHPSRFSDRQRADVSRCE